MKLSGRASCTLGIALWAAVTGAGCGRRGLARDAGQDSATAADRDAASESPRAVDAVMPSSADGAAVDGVTPGSADGSAIEDANAVSPPDARSDLSPEVQPDSPPSSPVVDPRYLGTIAVGPTEGWVGFPAYPDPSATAIGSDGAVYLAGSFTASTDFDPGPAADNRLPTGTSDGYLTKLNADGSRAWTLTWGGTGEAYVRVTAIAVGAASIAVAGSYTRLVDLDPGPRVLVSDSDSFGTPGGFVSRISLDGKLLWASSFLRCQPLGVAVDAGGAVYAGGGFQGTCDFDPGPGRDERTSGIEGAFLVKLEAAAGGLAWARTFDGGCEGHVNAVAVAASGDAWVTGVVLDAYSCVLGDTPVSGDLAKGGFFGSFSPAGQSKGAWRIARIVPQALAATPDGAIFVGGDGIGSVDFDRGPGTATRDLPEIDHFPTGFVLGLAPDGAFAWVQTRVSVSIRGLAPLAAGGVLALGMPSFSLRPPQGFLVERLDAAGTTLWAFRIGSDADLHVHTIAAGPSVLVISGGAYDSDDFDPGPAMDIIAARTTFFARYAF